MLVNTDKHATEVAAHEADIDAIAMNIENQFSLAKCRIHTLKIMNFGLVY